MGDSDSKADKMVAEAKLKMKPTFFGMFKKTEEAAELFEKAASHYKVDKQWKEAAETYIMAANAFKESSDETKARNLMCEAAKAYKKCSLSDAGRLFRIVAGQYQEAGQLTTAAKMHKEIAEMCEEERDLKGAIEALTLAADCFLAEDASTSANQCLVQVACLSAQVDDYKRAIEIFEQVGAACLDNKLLQYGAKDHYFKAVLCHLAMSAHSVDLSGVGDAISRYKDGFPAFEQSRECKFCDTIYECVKAGDTECYTDAVYEYDNISKFDNWKTGLLLTIKKSIRSSANLGIDDVDLT